MNNTEFFLFHTNNTFKQYLAAIKVLARADTVLEMLAGVDTCIRPDGTVFEIVWNTEGQR